MSDLLNHTISVFLGFFAIMNPIASTAVFLGLTGAEEQVTRKQIAFRSVITAFFIISFFCLLGKGIFELLGITLPAIRISGGVLVFVIGFKMLNGEQSKVHHPEISENDGVKDEKLDIAISPLAIPILAGPGTIATAMNYSATGSYLEIAITMVSFTVLCGITYFSFVFGQRIIKIIGKNGMNVITRLMGFILIVIGTQLVIQGIHDVKGIF
ncbi:MAG: NAAT family transporter [candidate division Zixibacteria bacterium]|nr:NAAT family transporter [Candidatus Tariuqbacter arcticus]